MKMTDEKNKDIVELSRNKFYDLLMNEYSSTKFNRDTIQTKLSKLEKLLEDIHNITKTTAETDVVKYYYNKKNNELKYVVEKKYNENWRYNKRNN